MNNTALLNTIFSSSLSDLVSGPQGQGQGQGHAGNLQRGHQALANSHPYGQSHSTLLLTAPGLRNPANAFGSPICFGKANIRTVPQTPNPRQYTATAQHTSLKHTSEQPPRTPNPIQYGLNDEGHTFSNQKPD